MTEQHPITPPPNLRRLWAQQAQRIDPHDPVAWQEHIATQAARWGADTELEACCEWLYRRCLISGAEELRATRRPAPGLKEQALAALSRLNSGSLCANPATDKDIILRALEKLND